MIVHFVDISGIVDYHWINVREFRRGNQNGLSKETDNIDTQEEEKQKQLSFHNS